MKSLKTIAVAGFLATALGQAAFAVDHVYITGSTAFRTAAIAAINAATGLAGPTGDDTNISGTGKTSYIWEGGTDSVTGNPVTVVATFTGSASGVGIVATSTAIPFLPDGSTGHNNPSTYDDSSGTTPHAGYPKSIPDFTFSDVYQSTTPFNTNAGYTDLSGNDSIVGIVTFKWMASKNFPLGPAGGSTASTLFSSYNVTPGFIKQLFSTGAAPLSFLSGNAADQHKEIFATGRNPDSGTRLTSFADSLYGVTNVVKQYQPTISSGAVTSQSLYPVQTIYGLISTGSVGNSGEASGGNLRAFLQATLPTSGLTGQNAGCTGAYYITYLGIGDASSVEGNSSNLTGAVELTYGGVQYSNTAIQQGQYSFWSYEHVMDRGDLNPTGGVAGTAAATDIEATMVSTIQGWNSTNANISGSGLQDDTNMKVKRSGDGLFIKPKFTF